MSSPSKAKEKDTSEKDETQTNDTPKAPSETSNQPVSKSQLKKKRRLERLLEKKAHKKERDREIKRAKAEAAGRDIEQDRKMNEEQFKKGKYAAQRNEKFEKRLQTIENKFQICVDCGYESLMTFKEINSLSQQLRYCYSNNKRSPNPRLLTITGIKEDSQTLAHLQNVSGFSDWNQKAFNLTPEPVEKYFADKLDRVVYLTSDSDSTLKSLDDDKIYVIGGIVDRNRLKGIANGHAQKIKVATAKLPIDEHLAKMESTRVLTVNHVFELLLKYEELGKDWKKALLSVLPDRKKITAD